MRAKTAMYDTRRILLPIHLPDAIAGTAANYGIIFISPAAGRYAFVGAEVVYTTKAGAACTLTVEKLTGAQAPGAGVALLAAAFDMTGDAEVVQYGSITGITLVNRTLGNGDRLCLLDTGNPAALRNVQVTIELEELVTLRAKEAPYEDERVIVTAVLYGAQPQTAAMHDKFFTASKPCKVVAAREAHTTASADALEFIQIEKLTGIEVPGAGTDLLTNNANKGFDGNGAADTVQTGTLTAVAASLILARGDRLALSPVDGNLGTLAGVCVTVELEAIA
jgi:hypothetical protein